MVYRLMVSSFICLVLHFLYRNFLALKRFNLSKDKVYRRNDFILLVLVLHLSQGPLDVGYSFILSFRRSIWASAEHYSKRQNCTIESYRRLMAHWSILLLGLFPFLLLPLHFSEIILSLGKGLHYYRNEIDKRSLNDLISILLEI